MASLHVTTLAATPTPPSSPPPRPRVGVGALLVVDDDGSDGGGGEGGGGGERGGALRVLIGERAGSHGAGRLALPGGHLDFGEPSFMACAAREAAEETGVELGAARFLFVHATNDVMASERLHYVTLFCAALVSPAEAAAARNLEPDKCLGWSLERLDALAADACAPRLFSPLARFLREGGEARVRALWPQLQAARAAAAAAAASRGGAEAEAV